MKNTLHTFTALDTGLRIPFCLDKFTVALPVSGDVNGGSILYGVGITQGIMIKETLGQVNEAVSAWYANNSQVAGRA